MFCAIKKSQDDFDRKYVLLLLSRYIYINNKIKGMKKEKKYAYSILIIKLYPVLKNCSSYRKNTYTHSYCDHNGSCHIYM